MSRIRVNQDSWPLIEVRFPETFTVGEYRQLFQAYRELSFRALKEDLKLVYLIDFTRFDPVIASPAKRRAVGKVFADSRETLALATAAEARVVTRAASRAILTAFDWLAGQPWPCRNFGSEAAARSWLAPWHRPADPLPAVASRKP